MKTIRLEQNYRSTQMILEGASAVVAQNTQRKGKNLWTAREGGSLIGYYEAPDGENEALFIADRVQRYLREAGQQEERRGVRCCIGRTRSRGWWKRRCGGIRFSTTWWGASASMTGLR